MHTEVTTSMPMQKNLVNSYWSFTGLNLCGFLEDCESFSMNILLQVLKISALALYREIITTKICIMWMLQKFSSAKLSLFTVYFGL